MIKSQFSTFWLFAPLATSMVTIVATACVGVLKTTKRPYLAGCQLRQAGLFIPCFTLNTDSACKTPSLTTESGLDR